jgi:hypothetical protein
MEPRVLFLFYFLTQNQCHMEPWRWRRGTGGGDLKGLGRGVLEGSKGGLRGVEGGSWRGQRGGGALRESHLH